MEEHSSIEITLRDLLKVFFRHKIVIVVAFATIMVTVILGLELRTPMYVAQVKMLVTGQMQKDVEYYRALGPGELIATQMELVRSRPIIERAVKALKLYQRPLDYEKNFATNFKKILIEKKRKRLEFQLEDLTPEQRHSFFFNKAMSEVNGNIAMSPIGTTSMFLIKVTDYNPSAAATIANVVSRSFVIFDIEQQIAELELTYGEKNETIIRLEKYIEKLEETLDGRILPDLEAMGPASVKIVTQAGPGRLKPMKPGKSAGIAIAVIMGIVTGIMLAYGFEYIDQTIKSPHDVGKFLEIPFLGSIPERKIKDNLLIKHVNPVSKDAKTIQEISSRIYVLMKNENLRSVLLADAEGSAENAAVIANIGVFSAHKTGCKVLVIDADLKFSMLSNVFGLTGTSGLADVLEGKIPIEDAVQDLGSNLSVLPAGETELDPVPLFESNVMHDLIKKAEERYDMVFVNCANIKDFTDVSTLLAYVNNFVLILNEGKVKRQIIEHVIAPLKQKNINMVGLIMNNCRHVIPEIIYRLT